MAICNETRLHLLTPPFTYVISVTFVINTILGTIGNLIVLIILYKSKVRSKTNKLLISLAISDLLVCVILSPLTFLELVLQNKEITCYIDKTRIFFVLLLIGASASTVSAISYDRYILLTKLTNYHQYITSVKLLLLLLYAWLVPIVVFAFFISGRIYLYFISILVLLFLSPLIALTISYYLIVKEIKLKEKKLQQHQSECPSPNGSLMISQMELNNQEVSTSRSSNKNKIRIVASKKDTKLHVDIAKAVILLILCYIVCLLPANVWTVLVMINSSSPFTSAINLQYLYIITMVTTQVNSTLNPIIYFSKNPEFKKGLDKLFGRNKVQNNKINKSFQERKS